MFWRKVRLFFRSLNNAERELAEERKRERPLRSGPSVGARAGGRC